MFVDLGYVELSMNRNPYRVMLKFRRNPVWYKRDYRQFLELNGDDTSFPIKANMPCVDDKDKEAGNTHQIYFMQDLYVAQKIFKKNPRKHVDIGSRVDGFVAHVASYREVELLDIRDLESTIPNVSFKKVDLMDDSTIPCDYCDSVSSLHALEHFGLGRYGDPIDPNGHRKGFANITKILKKGGTFYFSVPMGRQRIDFNAHRVFNMTYLIEWVKKDYDIVSFSYISDKGELKTDVTLSDENIKNSFGCDYGDAIFELRKKDYGV